LVTGATGTGKSRLLAALAADLNLTVIDPLNRNLSNQNEFLPANSGGIVIDHIHHFEGAKSVVAQAAEWCERYGGNLWLCEIWRESIERKGIEIQADAIEVHLEHELRADAEPPVVGPRIVGTYDQLLPLVRRIASAL
jgi:hypothetical protein